MLEFTVTRPSLFNVYVTLQTPEGIEYLNSHHWTWGSERTPGVLFITNSEQIVRAIVQKAGYDVDRLTESQNSLITSVASALTESWPAELNGSTIIRVSDSGINQDLELEVVSSPDRSKTLIGAAAARLIEDLANRTFQREEFPGSPFDDQHVRASVHGFGEQHGSMYPYAELTRTSEISDLGDGGGDNRLIKLSENFRPRDAEISQGTAIAKGSQPGVTEMTHYLALVRLLSSLRSYVADRTNAETFAQAIGLSDLSHEEIKARVVGASQELGSSRTPDLVMRACNALNEGGQFKADLLRRKDSAGLMTQLRFAGLIPDGKIFALRRKTPHFPDPVIPISADIHDTGRTFLSDLDAAGLRRSVAERTANLSTLLKVMDDFISGDHSAHNGRALARAMKRKGRSTRELRSDIQDALLQLDSSRIIAPQFATDLVDALRTNRTFFDRVTARSSTKFVAACEGLKISHSSSREISLI